MRDIIVTILVLIGLGYTLKRPYVGVLLWSWLGYMNPHRLCYGFAYDLPFSQVTAIVTMVAWLFSNESKTLPNNIIVYLLLFFIAWMGLTTFYAFHSEDANLQLIRILKIQLPIFLTMVMFNTKERLHQILWVIALSLAFFSVKGGFFTLVTAGSFRVYGPPQSYVEENNSLAVATLMVIPIMLYLRSQVLKKWQKQIMLIAIISMGISAIGSQSRGAFLAIMLIGLYYWVQSSKKMMSGLMIIIFIGMLASVLPDSWYERMNTINTYEKDASAMGRIVAWNLAINVANKNLFGGGLNLWSNETYISYLEGFNPGHSALVAHSIYFSVLGEHGWVGLFLFLLIFYLGWRQCTALVDQYDKVEHTQWVADLAKMLRVGLLAYLTGGAFLSLSYFDLPWHYLAIIVVLKEIARNTEMQPDELTNKKRVENNMTNVTLNGRGYIQ